MSEARRYRFCPCCASEFDLRTLDGRQRLVCLAESCGFIFYQNPTPAAGVIVYQQERLLLVKRAQEPMIGGWCLPAGFMEWDESPQKTAIREAQEETGLEVRIHSLFDIYSGDDDPRTNAVLALYLAEAVGGELSAGDDAEEAEFFPLAELPKNIAFATNRLAIKDFRLYLDRNPNYGQTTRETTD